MKKTIVYIDGFNLYYRLKRTQYKWLDITALSRSVLPDTNDVIGVNYYTARVSGRVDPDAPARQQRYLKALGSLPDVSIHYGHFQVKDVFFGLVQPPDFRPEFIVPAGTELNVAKVWKTEEKGSDVNLGAHLVRDAFQGKFEEAAVITNDTDLVEPIRIVTQEVGLPVALLAPDTRAAESLRRVATHVRHIRPDFSTCQLPDPVLLPDGKTVSKPVGW